MLKNSSHDDLLPASDGGKNSVSVVIPSIGRPCLLDAVESARAQAQVGKVEIIVVFDLPMSEVPRDAASAAGKADKVLYTGGGRRACHARNLGVMAAGAPWVAFLDDDDVWAPDKLAKQLDLAVRLQSQGKLAIVGSRAKLRIGNNAPKFVSGVPLKLVGPAERIEDYLFRNRRPGSRRASFFTSSILAPRQLCLDIPWDVSLERHQDWDWLVRAGRVEGAAFIQAEGDLITYNVGSEGSISAKADWEPSLLWAERVLAGSSQRTLVDFLAAQTLRYALQMRAVDGVLKTLGSINRAKKRPNFGPIIIGIAGIIPRERIQKLMSILK